MTSSKLISTVVLGFLSCVLVVAQVIPGSTRIQASSVQSRLTNTEWRLVSFGGTRALSTALEGTTITLKFGSDGRASGSGGCNSYSGAYRESGDSLSFSQIISTKRACLAQSANQQEQRYLAALESANKFKVSENSLTVYYGSARGALNFTNAVSAKTSTDGYENLTSPLELLASFYDAVNNNDYERAYHYWETPTSNFRDFARGYATTQRVQLILQPPERVEGAAGSLYADVPTVIVVRQRDGRERIFAGCYVTRKSNARFTDELGAGAWRIYRASMSPVANGAAIPKLLAQACRK